MSDGRPTVVVEIECDAIRKNEDECRKCDERFRCWTNKMTLTLHPETFSMERSVVNLGDKFTFATKVPRCFQCGNMVGSDVKIYMTGGTPSWDREVLNGVVFAQHIRAEGSNPMVLEIKGITRFP